MSLIDILRGARANAVSVLHEFKLMYDPAKVQVHAFVEGQADKGFYATFILPKLSSGRRLHLYDCRGKKAVYEIRERIKANYPDAGTLLFFVDKDLDDFIGAQPEMEDVFCTEVYSIENYLNDPLAIQRWFEEMFVLRNVRFDFASVMEFYRDCVSRFSRDCISLMSWALAHRKAGSRPNLSNIDMGKLFLLDEAGQVRWRRDERRIVYLDRVAQVRTTPAILMDMRRCARILAGLDASAWLRGKFFLWFLLQFIRTTEDVVQKVAAESGGSLKCQVQPHDGNLVELLAPRIQEPNRIAAFLANWLTNAKGN